MSSTRNGVTGRVAWGFGDQVFSSLTNFALNIIVVRSFGPSTFGAFAIAFGVYAIFLNLSRALTSEPLLIRFSQAERTEWADGARSASGLSILIGVGGGLILMIVAALSEGDLRSAFLAVGLFLPGLLFQDLWRFAFFASKEGHLAMLSDFIWALLMFPSLWVVLTRVEFSLFPIVVVWGLSSTLAGVIVSLAKGMHPTFSSSREWLSSHRDLTPHYVGEMLTGSVAAQVSMIGMGIVANLATVGAYRAAHVLFGPLRVIYQGFALFGIPEAVRYLGKSTHRLRKATLRTGVGLMTVALIFGTVLFLLPESWGIRLLGDTWVLIQPLIVPFTISAMGVGLKMPAFIGLRALEAAKSSFRTNLTVSLADVTATIAGASIGGAVGAAWAGGTTRLAGSGGWWLVFENQLKQRDRILEKTYNGNHEHA